MKPLSAQVGPIRLYSNTACTLRYVLLKLLHDEIGMAEPKSQNIVLDKTIARIRAEHDRWLTLLIPDEDEYIGSVTIGMAEVLRAHFLLIEYFAKIDEGVGGIGPKSPDLLHSALGRQFTQYNGKPKWTNKIDVCATLMFGLIKNHPFHDANKRTSFLVSMLHLQKIRRTPNVEAEEFEDFTVAIANNDLNCYSTYRKYANHLGDDSSIKVISDFLKSHTREIDLQNKIITYNELQSILSNFGYTLSNPKGNRIDMLKVEDKNRIQLEKPRRVAHVGFHGWTKEVSRKDIHIVRSAAKLDIQNGYDSQSFFFGHEDPLTLINKYKEPLRRLAYR